MINYYRSSVRTPPKKAEAALRPIKAPTLVIWGQRDHYLGPELAEPDHDDVPGLDRVERLPDASHWVHHDEHERVTQLLTDFSPRPTSQEPLNADEPRRNPGAAAPALLGQAEAALLAARDGMTVPLPPGQPANAAWLKSIMRVGPGRTS